MNKEQLEKRNEEIFRDYENHKIDPKTGTFKFRCTQCGKCCSNREDILLNVFDVCRLAKRFKMSNADILNKYTSVYVGNNSRVPVVALNMLPKTGKCPFMFTWNNRCSVHSAKPTVCYLFPLGRGVTVKEGRITDIRYFMQEDVSCGIRDETHTVESWIGRSIEECNEEYKAWAECIEVFSDLMKKAEEVYGEKIMEFLTNIAANLMYTSYTDDKPVIDQVKANAEEFKKICSDVKSIYEQVRDSAEE